MITLYRTAFSGLSGDIWYQALIVLVNRIGTMVTPFLSLYVVNVMDGSVAQAGGVLTVYGVGGLVGSILGGKLTDRVGIFRTQAFSLMSGGIVFLIIPQLTSITSLMIGVFLLTSTLEAFRPANLAAVVQLSTPENRTRAFALNRLAINLGMSIGPAIGGFLAEVDYHYLFYVDGATCLIASVLLIALIIRRFSRTLPDTRTSSARFRDVLKTPNVLIYIFALWIMVIVFFQIFSTVPIYLEQELGMAESSIGSLLLINGLLIVVFEMLIAQGSQRFHPLNVVRYGVLCISAGYLVLNGGTLIALAYVSVVILTVGEMMTFNPVTTFMSSMVRKEHLGTMSGIFMGTFAAAHIVSPGLGTQIYEHGGADLLWVVLAVLAVISFLLFTRIYLRVTRNASRTVEYPASDSH